MFSWLGYRAYVMPTYGPPGALSPCLPSSPPPNQIRHVPVAKGRGYDPDLPSYLNAEVLQPSKYMKDLPLLLLWLVKLTSRSVGILGDDHSTNNGLHTGSATTLCHLSFYTRTCPATYQGIVIGGWSNLMQMTEVGRIALRRPERTVRCGRAHDLTTRLQSQ